MKTQDKSFPVGLEEDSREHRLEGSPLYGEMTSEGLLEIFEDGPCNALSVVGGVVAIDDVPRLFTRATDPVEVMMFRERAADTAPLLGYLKRVLHEKQFEAARAAAIELSERNAALARKELIDQLIDFKVCGTHKGAMLRRDMRLLHASDAMHLVKPGDTRPPVRDRKAQTVARLAKKKHLRKAERTAKRIKKHEHRRALKSSIRTVECADQIAARERELVGEGLTPYEIEYGEWYDTVVAKATTDYFVALQHLAMAQDAVEEKAARLEDLGIEVLSRRSGGSFDLIRKTRVECGAPEWSPIAKARDHQATA